MRTVYSLLARVSFSSRNLLCNAAAACSGSFKWSSTVKSSRGITVVSTHNLYIVALLFTAIPRSLAAQPQLPTAPSTDAIGVKLEAPPLKAGEPIQESTIKSEVIRKTMEATAGFKLEAIATGTANAAAARGAILSGVPIGYGTLLRTRNAVNPGPPSDGNDLRVINLTQQPRSEVQIGSSNFLPVRFLEAGLITSKAVARVAIQFEQLPNAGIGTGFMVSPSLFMTNSHVIGSKIFATQVELHFNYQYALDGATIQAPTVYQLDPDSFFYTNEDLDFTLVRVKPRTDLASNAGAVSKELLAGDEFGRIALTTSFFYSVGQLANVIQHPQGRPKEIAVHENKVDSIFANVVHYTTDTEPGSSGSPVFNNQWRLIALHHAAGEQDAAGNYVDNEGIRIDRIIEQLKKLPPTTMPAAVIKELSI
jgi:V8-like Glu-specific endopeptidase